MDRAFVEVLSVGEENARDSIVMPAEIHWKVGKYHNADAHEILEPDRETAQAVDDIVRRGSDNAVAELALILARRAGPRGEVNRKRFKRLFKGCGEKTGALLDLARSDRPKRHHRLRKLVTLKAGDFADAFRIEPDDVAEAHRNLAMYGGISCLFQCLIGNGTATAGQALTYFSNAQAAIGVGDSTTAAAATQTDLQASTNKLRQAMDSTYPQHTDGTTSSGNTITFKATFGNSSANFAWNEVGVFNSATAATGRMLNRIVQTFGTKASGSWAMTCQITAS